MSEYILTWSNDIGRVMVGDWLFDILEKPELGFAYDALYFETPSAMYSKVAAEGHVPLTEAEMQACRDWCDEYARNADYPVQAYDPHTLVWEGTMLRSEAEARGSQWVLGEDPEYPVAKLVDGAWEKVVFAIGEKGRWIADPPQDDPRYLLHFTAAEWADHPKPSCRADIWDYKEEKWVDGRSLEQTIREAEQQIHMKYYSDRTAVTPEVPSVEMSTWWLQLREAEAWLEDREQATPFMDAMLSQLQGTGLTKFTLAQNILKYGNADYLAKMGEIHGKMYRWLWELRTQTTLAGVDEVMRRLGRERGDWGWNPLYQG